VIVEVAATKAQYFRAKKHLPTQKIVKEKEDGSLVLSYRVTQIIEMDDLVKRWIPHIRVVSPVALKEKIINEISAYLLDEKHKV
jgi:predicted DNA-binding transcriptional regulator YafY